LGVVCAAASLANPYGWQLHAHIYESLQSKWLMDFSREFQSPSFRNEFYYHLMFLLFAGLASATVLVQKRRLADAGIIVFLAYATLTSARHGSLYVLVATPWIAELASEWLMRWTGAQSKKSAGGTLHALALEKQPAFARLSLWTAVFAACLFLPLPLGTFPTDIKPEMAPDQLVQRNRQLLQGSRVFSDDEVGDYLIYRNYPRQRVFFDGRSDFYGEALANDYVALLGGGRKWREIAGRFGVDALLIDEGSALAAQVASSSEWTFVDKQAAWVLYRKEPQQTAAAARQ
jgi:hypothetical protein